MVDDINIAPVEESKETKEVETQTIPSEEKKEVTIGDALKTEEKPKEVKMVPESVLIEYKKETKEVRKELNALKKSIDEGATKKEVTQSIKDLAEKHNVDVDFLSEFASAVKKDAESEVEEKLSAKMKPIEEKEKAIERDKLFQEHFDKTLEEFPEYKNLVNVDVIKTLALDPRNANKTFAQIFQDSYGHLVTGKKTLESTKARGGKEDTEIDFSKARNDSEYFKEIMADPELRKKYNDDMAVRNRF